MERYTRLGRYSDESLEQQLASYRRLADEHWTGGHYALSRFAQTMATRITVELNLRAAQNSLEQDRALTLFGNHRERF